MFKKILYPTDFSDVAHKALEYMKRLKQAGTEEVVVLHVIDERWLQPGDVSKLREDMAKESDEGLRVIEEKLKGFGLRVRLLTRVGIPLREILTIEKQEDVSLIVLGSHGKSNIEEMLLGSVSEKVIRKCKNPVMVIKR
jgi:nucleotide-binding universal stress UspA family protein